MKKKTYIIITIMFVLGLFIGGCSTIQSKAEESNENVSIYLLGKILDNFECDTLIDEETGVNYIVLRYPHGSDISICPRYNADGSLYVSE